MQHPRLSADLQAQLVAVVGAEHLLLDEQIHGYLADTLGSRRQLLGVVRPASTGQVQAVVRLAGDHGLPLYPISSGRNWGYGSALPVTDGCLLVDLSRMKRILHLDPDLALLTVEPGVTQGDLWRHLQQQPRRFLVPVTGAGPDCSLIGNALERGYGITPVADHCAAIQSLEAVLPDGTLYRGALATLGHDEIEGCFKWGIGPHLDGLFNQSNLGIVTRMTFQLVPEPQSMLALYFWLDDDQKLAAAVQAIQQLLHRLPGLLGGVNLMNSRRLLSMMEPYPHEQIAPGGIMSDALVQQLARRNRVSAWMGFGALYGEKPLLRAARKVIARQLKGVASRTLFLAPSTIHRLLPWTQRLPGAPGRHLAGLVETLDRSLRVVAGEPSEIALPLAYWRSRQPLPAGDYHPARDGCGLIWYAPLVPMRPEAVARYREMVERICPEHGIEPLITFTSISPRCFDSTVPILFDRSDAVATARARACYDALLAAGRQQGFFPYRLHVDAMSALIDADTPHWRMALKIKQALDPQGIIAPGRYAPLGESDS